MSGPGQMWDKLVIGPSALTKTKKVSRLHSKTMYKNRLKVLYWWIVLNKLLTNWHFAIGTKFCYKEVEKYKVTSIVLFLSSISELADKNCLFKVANSEPLSSSSLTLEAISSLASFKFRSNFSIFKILLHISAAFSAQSFLQISNWFSKSLICWQFCLIFSSLFSIIKFYNKKMMNIDFY